MLSKTDRHNIALDIETKDKLKAIADEYNITMNDAVSAMMDFCQSDGSAMVFGLVMKAKRDWREQVNKDIWLAKTEKARQASLEKRKQKETSDQ